MMDTCVAAGRSHSLSSAAQVFCLLLLRLPLHIIGCWTHFTMTICEYLQYAGGLVSRTQI